MRRGTDKRSKSAANPTWKLIEGARCLLGKESGGFSGPCMCPPSRYIMNAKEAVAGRIIQLCNERNPAINVLENLPVVSPSTIYSMLNTKSKNPGVVSIQKPCDGLGIGARTFLDTPEFDALEQEIQ